MKRARNVAKDANKRPTKRRATAPPRRRTTRSVALAPELKFNDNNFSTDATTTGAVIAMNSFAAGDTAFLRDGNKISMKSVELRYTIELEAATTNALVRALVVYDRQTNGGTPTIATATTGPLDSISIASLRQVASMSRFKVLSDKTYALNQQNDTATTLQIMADHTYIKLPSDCQMSSYADGSASSPISGGLYLMYFSNIAAGAADVNFNGNFRVRYWG